jgi:acylphosphatase
MTTPVLHLTIRGLVQGVGYRWNLAQAARRLNVTGWVRNRHDGSVEAMVAGEPAALDELVAWARKGPGGARVDDVAIEPGNGRFDDFEQRPSA